MIRAAQIVTAITVLLSLASTARAESYCVACFGPDAVYRCMVADAPAGAPPDPRNQVQCIKSLAKSGGHARCSVERFSTKGCDGPERVISPTTAAIPLTQPPAASADPATHDISPSGVETIPAARDEPPAQPLQTQPPQTVEELAKKTVEDTKKGLGEVGSTVKTTTEKAGEQIGGVGSAIGNAAKKSWDCVTSLFNDC